MCSEPHSLIYRVCSAHIDKSLQGLDTLQFMNSGTSILQVKNSEIG